MPVQCSLVEMLDLRPRATRGAKGHPKQAKEVDGANCVHTD